MARGWLVIAAETVRRVVSVIGDRCSLLFHDDEEAWKATRRDGIPASKVAAALALSKWQKPVELLDVMRGKAPPEDLEHKESVIMGRMLEPVVAARFEQLTGWETVDLGRLTVAVSRELPWQRCTLDRLVWDGSSWGVLECKTAGWHMSPLWRDDEEAPIDYQVQVQAQLDITGLAWGYLACLVGGQRTQLKRIERNPAFAEMMRAQCGEFWAIYQSGAELPPEWCGGNGGTPGKAFLARLYPKQIPEKTIELSSRLADLDLQRARAKQYVKQLEAGIELIDNEIKAAMGDAERGELPNGGAYTWKETTRKSYVVKETTYRKFLRVGTKPKLPPLEHEIYSLLPPADDDSNSFHEED